MARFGSYSIPASTHAPLVPLRALTPPLSPGASVSVSDDEGPEGWRLIDRHPRGSGGYEQRVGVKSNFLWVV
jgi:hypothetical protein